jgi:hypothetical protein
LNIYVGGILSNGWYKSVYTTKNVPFSIEYIKK